MSLYQSELDWIHSLQNTLRSPAMDAFFRQMNHLDSIGFALFLICITWHLIHRRIGIQLFYIFILSAVLNKFFKNLFGLPRPCQVDSTVAVLCSATFGFPSGAGQTSVIIAGIVMLEFRRHLYWYLAILFALLLSFSRIYLGLHYFTDIIGGWLVGIGLVAIYWKVFPALKSRWKIYVWLFPVLIFALLQSLTVYFLWASLGVAIGLLLNDRKRLSRTTEKMRVKWIRTLIVLLGLSVCYWGIIYHPQYSIPLALLSGVWLTFPFGRQLSNSR